MVEQCVRRTGALLSSIDVLKKSAVVAAVARNLAETKSEDFVQYVAKRIAHQMENQHSSIDVQRRNVAVDVVPKSQVEIKCENFVQPVKNLKLENIGRNYDEYRL